MTTNNYTIEFCVSENEEPTEIQLEPEVFLFKVEPGNCIRFVGINCAADFTWAMYIYHRQQSIQLCPNTLSDYDIEIYENDVLLDNWYKYM